MLIWIVSVTAIALLGGTLLGPIMSRVEQAKYKVDENFGAIEIRTYAPMIIAEVHISGDQKKSINEGFRLIADYIFGNNTAQKAVAMTAPVLQQTNQSSDHKIKMTAPVLQQGKGDLWSVRFVMPSNYTLETLPKPNNPKVVIHQVSERKFIVIRFSGSTAQDNLDNHAMELENFIKSKHIVTVSPPIYAFFNPPWTMPFMRRNEVMIEIEG